MNILVILVCAVGLSFTAQAQETMQKRTNDASISTANQDSSSDSQSLGAEIVTPSRRANIDPNTGELTSKIPATNTNTTVGSTANQTTQQEPIKYTTHPDGTVEGELNGHFQSNYNVNIGCDGSLNYGHSEEPAQAQNHCKEEK